MAKKYYDGDISLNTDWGGDESTGNLPVIGEKVQKVIKEGINSKVGYVGRVDGTGSGFYVLTRDEETFNAYLKTITEDQPFGDLMMDGVNGRFDAPFNYKLNLQLINPENGYKSTLVGSTGNVIKFKAETLDNNDSPQGESMTITFKIRTEGGLESTYTAIYDADIASKGIEYNLDGKLAAGQNIITITATGMNTGMSAMKRITYRLIDMSFNDRFDIAKRYQFTDEGTLALNVGYSLKGVGKTKLVWYFDGNLYATDENFNENPDLQNTSKTFYFTESTHTWLTPGVHTMQVSMICRDTDSGEEFQTPIYYREFIVEKTPTVLETPYIVRKASFDSSKGFLKYGENPTIYDAKQYDNVTLEYAAYYNGKSACKVNTYITYAGMDMMEVSSEELPLVSDDFSNIQSQLINLTQYGIATVALRAMYGEEYFETTTNLEIAVSDMNITTVEDSVALYLNAFGRSNNSANKDSWEYVYTDEYGQEQKVTTDFSKNEYVNVSEYNEDGNVIVPSDSTSENTREVNTIPMEEVDDVKYLLYNGEYYIWTREFDWSNTSGWSDGKLKLSNGNAITINYQPFSREKLTSLKQQGATFEFEFETTNVYNDNAVICRICGNKQYAPGISIYASGAELVISREVTTEGENAGYTKAVSTKYKSEESNRISFVITPDEDSADYRNRILSIYVNGELCGAYAYDNGTNFMNDSNITFRGSEDACVNILSIKMYKRALSSTEILNNYIYYRTDTNEKAAVYKRNDIVLATNADAFDSDKLKSQLPVFTFYQIYENESLDDIHQEKKNKKLPRHFDVTYIDIQNPSKNFVIKNAYITPQGTSSMNYPVKNLRLYTDKDKKSPATLYVGSNIFLNGSVTDLREENLNPECIVSKKKYSFRDKSIPVKCWCLKADFAESSSSHNTGTARYWNEVLKNSGLMTKAQAKVEQHKDKYPYDVRTTVDGFPVVVFYQALDGSAPRFEGKYNFNNDKSTEDVFGFTGGVELDDQEVAYFYIGKEKPMIQSETDDKTGEVEYACSWAENAYTETPTVDSPLYVSDDKGNWYMLRGKELLDNPKMECWELLNSVNEIALFKTMKGFGIGDGNEKVGIVDGENFDGAFESRYPDCGDYFHTNSLRRFGEWLVSCRYLDIDPETGASVPFAPASLPAENYHKNEEGKLSICSLTKKTGTFKFNFPGKNFYSEVNYNDIASNIKKEGYQQVSLTQDVIDELEYEVVESIPETKLENVEFIKCGEVFYTWMPSNLLIVDVIPEVHESAYDYVLVGETYYAWNNTYNYADYHETQWVDDSAFNRALKFAIEKYDHIEMDKMAAYYIYLMRFGGVDQTVKNSMLTTEGPNNTDPNSTLPSLWYFINYDNDTILGVKNDGRLVFDPYITRQTKDGTGYVYAGRESTLWNNLEEDAEFMSHVTTIDNKLADGGSSPSYSLSYANALREYDTDQSDKWCERIYNKDAERKYIDTYVKGWTQKNNSAETSVHVFEDYLYDVQGSRSAHRKWWLGRRFNVFDSRFCNANFRNSLIKFRSTNLPAGSVFKIKSGEPVFYAWGHDNAVTEITPTAIQPGNSYDFVTSSAFNIGSYLELMGAANISTFDLRGCVGALTEIDVTGCYSSSVGTKMKEILIGDHTRTDLINISNTSMKFSGLGNAKKLEVLDVTNIGNVVSLDGLSGLLNLREFYGKGTSVANISFADGAMIEKIELPTAIETLSLVRSSNITYDNIKFEDGKYGKLNNLTIDNCANLMTDHSFVTNWIGSKTPAQRANLVVNLQGINWKFNYDYDYLFLFEGLGDNALTKSNIRGTIEITQSLPPEVVNRLKNIFGQDCFKEGSTVFIKAPTGLYVDMPDVIWEGESNVKCEITTVGTTLAGELQISALVNEKVNGVTETKVIGATNGIITMDESNLNKGYVTLSISESDRIFEMVALTVTYNDGVNPEMMQPGTSLINKRSYPNKVTIESTKDSYNNKTKNAVKTVFTPNEINNVNLAGRGNFSVLWTMKEGSSGYLNSLVLHDADKETAYIQAPAGFDGTVVLNVVVTRDYDSKVLCSTEKEFEFTNPDTIITKYSNEPVYNVLVNAGIIREDETGFGKLTKTEAAMLDMNALIKNGKSIFADNKEITSFLEFQYFSNTYMGQMPQEGIEKTVTPNGLFSGCTNLKEIAFSNNFKYTAKDMFKGCTKLEAIYGPQTSEDENGNPIYNNLAFEYVGENFASGCPNLKTCTLSTTAKYIGTLAFSGCSSLQSFRIPTSKSLEVVYNNGNTPFVGCKEISFDGAELGGVSEAKYQVKDGAVYEVRTDGTLGLVHMGKNTLMSQIPTDKTVYACAYAMEYRTEEHIKVPTNVVFNGEKMFYNSIGNSIELTRSVAGMKVDYLFSKAQYNTYKFVDGETVIPNYCFNSNDFSTFTEFVIPDSVTSIGTGSFTGAGKLTSVTFPKSLLSFGHNAFWSCSSLKTLIFRGSIVPKISQSDFFAVRLDDIFVPSEHYQKYKDEIMNLLVPFVRPQFAYAEGYLRIIKDANFLWPDDMNVVKVGGLDVTVVDDYMKYTSETEVSPIVTLNGEEVGYVKDLYTTLYLGDNSSLYSGDGYDFTHGVYDQNVIMEMNNNGWFYDVKVGGIRNKQDIAVDKTTTMTFNLPAYTNKTMNIEYGWYASDKISGTFTDGTGTNLLTIVAGPEASASGYHKNLSVTLPDGILKVGVTRNGQTLTGLNGFVINKIGDAVYTDPELPAISMMLDDDMTNVNIITVNLTAEQEITNKAVVTVTDGFAHTYRKAWNGQPLMFVVPVGYNFTVSASDFVSETGKAFFAKNTINTNSGEVNINYETRTGIEVKNGVLGYYTDYNDYYIVLDKKSSVWSELNNSLPTLEIEDVFMSDADGFVNTISVLTTESENQMFKTAYECKSFETGVKGYIPSYVEMEMLSLELDEINAFIIRLGYAPIDFSNCWTSESFDSNDAWTSDGEKLSKNTVCNYYIFGKRINF
jgi:hypothetical protein